MLINNYSELERNCEILKRYTEKYRDEITVCAGLTAESYEIASYDDVVKLYDSWNDDMFYGNMLLCATNSGAINDVVSILTGEKSYIDYLESAATIKFNKEDFEKKLKEYREERA